VNIRVADPDPDPHGSALFYFIYEAPDEYLGCGSGTALFLEAGSGSALE